MFNLEKSLFPQGKERKDLLKSNEEIINKAQEENRLVMRKNHNYTNIDSHLEDKDANFSFFFRNVLPEREKDMRSYIESSLKEKQGKAVGVEFGGIGQNLFRGFSNDIFKETFGVTLADHRKKWKIKIDEFENKKRGVNHNVIEGDILSDGLYDSLNEKLKGRKVDLIIERMFKGIEFMPPEPYKLSQILGKWYEMLNENGIMFVQSPVVFNNLLDKWADMLHEKYNDIIEFQYEKGIHDAGIEDTGYSSFRLRKLNGAPKELPFLDSRTVSTIEKWTPLEKNKKYDWHLE
jgi:hypothetical protein